MADVQMQLTLQTIFLYKTSFKQLRIHLLLPAKAGSSFQPASLMMPAVFCSDPQEPLSHKSHD